MFKARARGLLGAFVCMSLTAMSMYGQNSAVAHVDVPDSSPAASTAMVHGVDWVLVAVVAGGLIAMLIRSRRRAVASAGRDDRRDDR